MSNQSTYHAIQDFLHTHLLPTDEAYLYGSQARGDQHEDSDWDVLILMDKATILQNDYNNISYPLSVLGIELGENINPILYTKKDWQKYSFTPFYKNVTKDAIKL